MYIMDFYKFSSDAVLKSRKLKPEISGFYDFAF